MSILNSRRRWLVLFAILPTNAAAPWFCLAVLHVSPWWSFAWTLPLSFFWGVYWAMRWGRQDERDRDLRVLRGRVEDYLRGVR